MKQYMKKTEPVSAIQYVDDNFDEIIKNIALYIEDIEKISIIPPEDNVIFIARAENPDFIFLRTKICCRGFHSRNTEIKFQAELLFHATVFIFPFTKIICSLIRKPICKNGQ